MPKVSDSYREARRDEIARAALRCIERSGFNDATIADIVRESGLSAGAIYSNFTNKGELARYIVAHFLGVRREELEAAGRRGEVRSPRELLEFMLAAYREAAVHGVVPLQFWAAAAVDGMLRGQLDDTIGEIRSSLTVAVTPWVAAQPEPPETAQVVRGIMGLAQGYITFITVTGKIELDDYLVGVALVTRT
jgi:AcrR family transcriptional regulator